MSNTSTKPFIHQVQDLMMSARERGESYIMLDSLAEQTGITDQQSQRKNGRGKHAVEVIEDRIESLAKSSADMGLAFPWTLVSYRNREAAGLGDMPKTCYREYEQEGKGTNRYYVPALVWTDRIAKPEAQDQLVAIQEALLEQLRDLVMSYHDVKLTSGNKIVIEINPGRLAALTGKSV